VSGRRERSSNGLTPTLTMMALKRSNRRLSAVLSVTMCWSLAIARSGRRSLAADALPADASNVSVENKTNTLTGTFCAWILQNEKADRQAAALRSSIQLY
jgi:hypothetical protein